MLRLLLLAPLAPALLTAQSHTLTVSMKGFLSDKGTAEVLLFDQPSAFPTKRDKAIAKLRVPVANGAATALFRNIAPGTYAVAVYHDANNNGMIDANFIGVPREQTGASNNARGKMGPPAFRDARFAITGDQSITITMQ